MTPEQVVSILALLADLRLQITEQQQVIAEYQKAHDEK